MYSNYGRRDLFLVDYSSHLLEEIVFGKHRGQNNQEEKYNIKKQTYNNFGTTCVKLIQAIQTKNSEKKYMKRSTKTLKRDVEKTYIQNKIGNILNVIQHKMYGLENKAYNLTFL